MSVKRLYIQFVLLGIFLFLLTGLPGNAFLFGADTLVFDMTGARINAGIIEVPVSIKSDQEVTSFDFQLKFNTSRVSFNTIQNHRPYLSVAYNYNPTDNFLRFSGYSLQSIEKNVKLITIRFNWVSGILTPPDFLELNPMLNGESCIAKVKGNLCHGSSMTISAPSGPGYSYLWSTGEITQTITVDQPGSYVATIDPGNGSSFSSIVTVLKDIPLPSVTVLPEGPVSFCPGDSVLLTASTGADNFLQWSTGETSQTIYAKSTGIYTVTATEPYGCHTASAPVDVSWLPLPDAGIMAGGPTEFCQGNSVSLFLLYQEGNTYRWSTGDTLPSINVTTQGQYSATVTGTNGCVAVSQTVEITVYALPLAAITPDGPVDVCPGDSVVLQASLAEGNSYLWSTGSENPVLTVYQTGDYFVTITETHGCSAVSQPLHVRVGPLLGDINLDGTVDVTDYLLLVSQFNAYCAQCPEDLDGNGIVDVGDYLLLVGKFGFSCN